MDKKTQNEESSQPEKRIYIAFVTPSILELSRLNLGEKKNNRDESVSGSASGACSFRGEMHDGATATARATSLAISI